MLDFHATVDPNISRLFYAQPADTNHVLAAIKDVQEFYQDSFDNLLWTMGIIISVGFLLVGVVMPLVLQWLQSRSFIKTEQKILEKFQNDIEAAKADLTNEIHSIIKELKQEVGKKFTRVNAISLMDMASNLALTSANIFEIILLALRAARGFAELRDTKNLVMTISLASASGKKITQTLITLPIAERKKCVRLLLEACETLLNELKDKKLDTKYFEQVLAIRTTVSKIKLNP